MQNFRTYQLAKRLYIDSQKLKLKNPMKDQFDRASLSIVLNIAEGSGKSSAAEKKRFYSIAMGSLRETQAILDLVGNPLLAQQADRLAASLYRLIQNPGTWS